MNNKGNNILGLIAMIFVVVSILFYRWTCEKVCAMICHGILLFNKNTYITSLFGTLK